MAEILEPSFRKRKLAAILHADVVGFSRLMGKDEAGTHQTLGELRRAVDPLIAAHGGRIVGTAGDSLLADFSSIVDALSCAVEMQRASRAIKEPVAPERRLEINPGDVENIMARGSVFVWAGRAAEAMPWLEGALRFDRANARAAFLLGTTYYFLDRYGATGRRARADRGEAYGTASQGRAVRLTVRRTAGPRPYARRAEKSRISLNARSSRSLRRVN
jgi:hypothetical protein